jgi:hypothetical protein
MSQQLANHLAALAAQEATVIPAGGSTPVGSGNAYADPPITTATSPLRLPAVLNVVEGWDEDDQRQGFIPTTYMIAVYLFTSLADPEKAWADARPYLGPLRAALMGPPIDGNLQYRDPTFGQTCIDSEQSGGLAGIFTYRGRPYYGLRFVLKSYIHEPLTQ